MLLILIMKKMTNMYDLYIEKKNFEFVDLNLIWETELYKYLNDEEIEKNLKIMFTTVIEGIEKSLLNFHLLIQLNDFQYSKQLGFFSHISKDFFKLGTKNSFSCFGLPLRCSLINSSFSQKIYSV